MKQVLKESNKQISTDRKITTTTAKSLLAQANNNKSVESLQLIQRQQQQDLNIPSVKVNLKQQSNNQQQQHSNGGLTINNDLMTPKKEQQIINIDLQSSQKIIGQGQLAQLNSQIRNSIQFKTPSFQNTNQKQNEDFMNYQQLSEVKTSQYQQKQQQQSQKQQKLQQQQHQEGIESANLSAIMMPMNQSQLNGNDESMMQTFIRESQSLLQVIPSAYSTKEKDLVVSNGIQQKQQQKIFNFSDNSDIQKQSSIKGTSQIQVYEPNNKPRQHQNIQRYNKNPYTDQSQQSSVHQNRSHSRNNNQQNLHQRNSRSLSQVSITLKENPKQDDIPLKQNPNLCNKQQQEQNYNNNSDIVQILVKMNTDLRDEFRQFQQQTQDKISDLEMRHINQQETIDYLLNMLQSQGINVFNKQDLKDDSIKDSIQLRKQKLRLENHQQNQQDNQKNSGQDMQKNESENLYYYSQEEMFKHNETSNYDEVRNRNLSEPDIVNRIAFDDSQQNDGQQINNNNDEDIKEQTVQSFVLGSEQDEVQIKATNYDYRYLTKSQEDCLILQQNQQNLQQYSIDLQEQDSSNQQQQLQSVTQSNDNSSTLSNKLLVIDLQNQSYPSNKHMQQYSTFHKDQQNYVSGNSNTFQQYLQNNQSKMLEKSVNLIQSIESQEKICKHIEVVIESNEVSSRLMQSDYQLENLKNFAHQCNDIDHEKIKESHLLAVNKQTIDDEGMFSLGSSPTYRNREDFKDKKHLSNQMAQSQSDPKLINFVKTNNNQDQNQFDDSQMIYSIQMDEELIDQEDQQFSSNHIQSSMLDEHQHLYKLQEYSHNYDTVVDRTTLFGINDKTGTATSNQISSKNAKSLTTNATSTQKPIFHYLQCQNEQSIPSNTVYSNQFDNILKGSFLSADKSSKQYKQKSMNQYSNEYLKQEQHPDFQQIQGQLQKQFQNKMNQRSRSQNGFTNANRNLKACTYDIILQNQFIFNEQNAFQTQQQHQIFESISIKQIKNNYRQRIQSKDIQQHYLESISNSSKPCCQNGSSKASQNQNGINYCCSQQIQKSVEVAYSCDLRKLQDMNVVVKLLNQYQGQILLSDLLSKNLNLQIQKELITELSQSFSSNPLKYEKRYLISLAWWKDWCKYTNYVDEYLTNINQLAYQTGVAPINKIPIKNFNDLVKSKRPESIKNSGLLSQDKLRLQSDSYIQVSVDIWTFLLSWYEADYKIKVTPIQLPVQSQKLFYKQRTNSSNNVLSHNSEIRQIKMPSNSIPMNSNNHNIQTQQLFSQNSTQQQFNTLKQQQQYLSKQMTINTLTNMMHSEKTVFQVNPDEALSTPNYNQEFEFDGGMKRSSSGKQHLINEDQTKLHVQGVLRQTIQTDRNTVRNL